MDFKKIKGLFVESVDEPKPAPAQPSPAKEASPPSQASEPKPQAATPKIDSKILDSLIKAIESNNLPGEDYLEFTEALKALKDLPIDDNLKIQTVMATLSTKGLTKQKVMESATYYLKILENERTKFYDALKLEVDKQVNRRNEAITKLEQENKAKADQIAKLNAEIEANKATAFNLKNEILSANQKFSQTENDFLLTYNYVAEQINGNLSKIKNL
jgi:hypothetical protein